jgi:TonB family protein
VTRANAIYFAQVDRSTGFERYIIEEIWRHDPRLGASPVLGSEFDSKHHQSVHRATGYADHAIICVFKPWLEKGDGHHVADSRAMVFNDEVPAFAASAKRIRAMVAASNWKPSAELALNPVGESATAPQRSVARPAGETPPKLISSVPPQYPRALQSAFISGDAMVECLVRKNGTVGEVRVIRATDVQFGEAAKACVAQWRYQPATRDDEPVEALLNVPVSFRIREAN